MHLNDANVSAACVYWLLLLLSLRLLLLLLHLLRSKIRILSFRELNGITWFHVSATIIRTFVIKQQQQQQSETIKIMAWWAWALSTSSYPVCIFACINCAAQMSTDTGWNIFMRITLFAHHYDEAFIIIIIIILLIIILIYMPMCRLRWKRYNRTYACRPSLTATQRCI